VEALHSLNGSERREQLARKSKICLRVFTLSESSQIWLFHVLAVFCSHSESNIENERLSGHVVVKITLKLEISRACLADYVKELF